MRGAGIATLALVAAACGSGTRPTAAPTPSRVAEVADPAGPPWSAWSEPVNGLSCRVNLPARALRGDVLLATVQLRLDPTRRTPERKYLSLRPDQATLVLRNRTDAGSAPVRIEYPYERVLETPVLEEEGVESPPLTELERHPDWHPLADAASGKWEFHFQLAMGWEALVPGEWEAHLEIEAGSGGESPSLWTGTLRTTPIPLVLEEPPPRRLRALVPSLLRILPGRVRGTVTIGFDEGDGDFADLEPRHGFRLGIRSGSDTVFTVGLMSEEWTGFEFREEFDRVDGDGPLVREFEVEIFETVVDEDGLRPFGLWPGEAGYRALWKRSFRVTATAAEIEALRR